MDIKIMKIGRTIFGNWKYYNNFCWQRELYDENGLFDKNISQSCGIFLFLHSKEIRLTVLGFQLDWLNKLIRQNFRECFSLFELEIVKMDIDNFLIKIDKIKCFL